MKKTPVDLQQRFTIYHACPKYLAAYRGGSAFTQDGLASRQEEHDKVEVTLVERVIVHCVLIQHLQNLSNHSYTSSVRIGLKFVLLHLSSDFSEKLLFLSFKENPDSFVFHFETWFSFFGEQSSHTGLSVLVCAKKD